MTKEEKFAYMIGTISPDEEIVFELRFKTASEKEEDIRGLAVLGSEDAKIPRFVAIQDIPKIMEIEKKYKNGL